MKGLDKTDFEILRLLLEDARRPYSEIAEKVDLSSPAVSDRVEKMREIGVINGFTVDLDRSTFEEGMPLLVELEVGTEEVEGAKRALEGFDEVENVYVTAESHVFFKSVVRREKIRELVSGMDGVKDYDVNLLVSESWNPYVGDAELALECDECGNRVTSEGESALLDDKTYHFCCSSCKSKFVEKYEQLKEGA